MGSLSVGKLFMGAFLPGLVLSSLYMIFITAICFFRPHWGPSLPPEERAFSPLKKLTMGITSVLPPIALIFAVLGSIFFGLASPTEAASVGAAGAVVITLSYRRFSWKVLKESLYETALSTGMIFWILVGASAYAAVFLGLGGDKVIADLLLGLEVSPFVVLAVILFILFLLGMVMEWIAIALIAIPVFFPIIIELGFSTLWFGILFAVVLQTAFLTPPYGGALFLLRGIAPKGVTMGNIWRGAYLFIPFQLAGLALCVFFPQIVLWLPGLMIK
jgi:tripartite ATP-independent transporter DctM subunit